MESKKLSMLKVACNQFYMNKQLDQPRLSDQEFDELRKQFESEGGKLRDLVDWEDDVEFSHEDTDNLSKIIAESNDLKEEAGRYLSIMGDLPAGYYMNYKYDGSSIKAYYENGKLKSVLSTPHLECGLVRTKSFINIFPKEVDPAIKSIQGEVLVDAAVYGQLARNKANGLTNSKDMIEEVEREVFVRAYRIQFHEGPSTYLRQKHSLEELPTISRIRHRLANQSTGEFKDVNDLIFAPAIQLKWDQAPTSPIVDTEPNVLFQVDGVVMYSEAGIQGIKFYYTEYADVLVEEVHWDRKSNGSFAPTLKISECVLNEKVINYVTASGVPNLINNKMGKGAIVRLILANMTIPKVIDVLEESEDYQFPMCQCGHQCTADDIVGAMLKCTENEPCEWKVNNWLFDMAQRVIWNNDYQDTSFEDYFESHFDFFMEYLYIDRWTPDKKYDSSEPKSEFIKVVTNCIKNNDVESFIEEFKSHYYYTSLNELNFDINVKSTFNSWVDLMKLWGQLTQDVVNVLYQKLN